MSAKKRNTFGVPMTVFLLILLGVVGSLLVPEFVVIVLVPVTGYYVWDLRQKNKELEERVAALEGHPVAKSDQS
jgi:hypothetical protein